MCPCQSPCHPCVAAYITDPVLLILVAPTWHSAQCVPRQCGNGLQADAATSYFDGKDVSESDESDQEDDCETDSLEAGLLGSDDHHDKADQDNNTSDAEPVSHVDSNSPAEPNSPVPPSVPPLRLHFLASSRDAHPKVRSM